MKEEFTMAFISKSSKEYLEKSKKRLYLFGGITLFIGFLSLAMPLLASFAVEALVGGLLLAVGINEGIGAFRCFKDGDNPWQQLFMAVISLAAGLIFLFRPLAGVMTLSILLSAYFLIDGVTKVVEYFRLREVKGSIWILISGILGIILAFLMWKNIFTGIVMVGVLFGVNLVFSGMCMILLGRACSKASKFLDE